MPCVSLIVHNASQKSKAKNFYLPTDVVVDLFPSADIEGNRQWILLCGLTPGSEFLPHCFIHSFLHSEDTLLADRKRSLKDLRHHFTGRFCF